MEPDYYNRIIIANEANSYDELEVSNYYDCQLIQAFKSMTRRSMQNQSYRSLLHRMRMLIIYLRKSHTVQFCDCKHSHSLVEASASGQSEFIRIPVKGSDGLLCYSNFIN